MKLHMSLAAAILTVTSGCHTTDLDFYAGGAQPGTSEVYYEPDESEEDETEEKEGENPWVSTQDDAMSTFGADVDTGSYTLMRQSIGQGQWPPADGVRVEEYINYFNYGDPSPKGDEPFKVSLESAPSYFGDDGDIQMLRIGMQAKTIPLDERDPVNLVFLIDVSGSMGAPYKLGLVKYALGHLVDRLSPEDTLGIVVYAGADRVVLEPTPVIQKSVILDAIDDLRSGGSTNGEAGIRKAYDMAESAFRSDGVNRVILCTDGDFNVGLEGQPLIRLIEDFRDRDIFLTTLGFGMGSGNYNDDTMEQLADHGNGNYAFIDTHNEALRVLGEKLVGTLQVVAKDVKVQVEFNPDNVKKWRLVGYENRLLEHYEFNDDSVDSGDIGAGHSVTALYEIELTEQANQPVLHLQQTNQDLGDIAEVRIRHKAPDSDDSSLMTWTIDPKERAASFDSASDGFQFSAAVAEYAEILRMSMHSEGKRFDEVAAIVERTTAGEDRAPVEAELLRLIETAKVIDR